MACFDRLFDNIVDLLAEQQLKLGYMEETVSLYYPLESLQTILGENCDAAAMLDTLQMFIDMKQTTFGCIDVSYKNNRFCFRIPPVAGAYVHALLNEESREKYLFLQEFLQAIIKHGQTIDEIIMIFKRYSKNVVVRKINENEFDYLIYFEDGIPDDYRYCFKLEECHITYHRFMTEDFERF